MFEKTKIPRHFFGLTFVARPSLLDLRVFFEYLLLKTGLWTCMSLPSLLCSWKNPRAWYSSCWMVPLGLHPRARFTRWAPPTRPTLEKQPLAEPWRGRARDWWLCSNLVDYVHLLRKVSTESHAKFYQSKLAQRIRNSQQH